MNNIFKKTSMADEISESMNKYLTKNASEELVETNKISRAMDLVSMATDKLDRIKAWAEVRKLTKFLEIMANEDASTLKSEIKNEEAGLHETGTPFRRQDYKAEDHELVVDDKDLEKVESMLKDFEDE